MAEERYCCPKCQSTDCWRDEVDIGVGTMYGPWRCNACGWFELEPDEPMLPLNDEEIPWE